MNRFKVVRTRTHGFSVDNVANSVDSARFFARVYASARLADAQQRTVDVAVRAQALFPAPFGVRVADVAGRAPAHVPGRGIGVAHGGGVARRLVAHFDRLARYFGYGVGPEARRALAKRLVPVGEAHGVRAARVIVAQVRARMRLPVAHLRLRTIVVVHARNPSAAGRRVRVAGVRAGRTLALRHVIVGHANGVRAALRTVTDRLARFRSAGRRRFHARFGGRTFDVLLATARFLDRATAVPVVCVAHETGRALAAALVLTGHAYRVERARERRADRRTLQHVQRVRFARLVVRTVGVHRTVGQRRFLALGHYGIPCELRPA